MRIIGIDPGVNGACALLSETGKFIDCFDMPTVLAGTSGKTGNRQIVNAYELAKLIRSWTTDAGGEIVAITELVHAMPEQGVSSVFAFGKSYGIVLGVLAAIGISTHTVSPQKWKGFYQLSRDKDASREVAQRLWPAAPLGRKKDHNKGEALLLARYYQQRELRTPAPCEAGQPAMAGTAATAGDPF